MSIRVIKIKMGYELKFPDSIVIDKWSVQCVGKLTNCDSVRNIAMQVMLNLCGISNRHVARKIMQ